MPRFLNGLLPFILIILCMKSNSQPPVKNYPAAWKKVNAFVSQNLPKSALAEVKKIYSLAKKEKQEAQVIKALVHMSAFQQETREDNDKLSITETEKELKTSTGISTAILNSLLAGQYLRYYNNNRWEMMDRTRTVTFSKTDIATWDAEDFHKKISALYLLSLKDSKTLQNTRLEPWDALLVKGNVRHLRPTLFDLLAHEALEYFESGEEELSKPAEVFEISGAEAFDPATDFVKRKFTSPDSLSLQHKALLLYQQLIRFHLTDTKPDALIDADLKRLQFVYENSVHPEKEELYFSAVNHIARQYENLPAAAQAWYLLAEIYNERGQQYKPYGDSTHRYDRIKAREICEKLQLQKDSSEGKINAWNLLLQLNQKNFSFQVEKVNSPDLPFRVLVKYRHINGLHLRLIKADEKLREALENQYNEHFWPTLLKATALKTWWQSLPDTKDLQEHSTEIKADGLPAGEYILLASEQENPASKNTLLGARYFYVSAISYISQAENYFVLDRESGQPLAGASVQVWWRQYDYKKSKYLNTKRALYTTGAKGEFVLEKRMDPENHTRNSFLLEIRHGKDKLFMTETENDFYYSGANSEKESTRIHLFTDRSIYRPGQTLHFKGIVLWKDPGGRRAGVRQEYSSTLYLRDANYQDIDSLKVNTNDFGSFSGKFRLPSGTLNGAFSIYTKNENGLAEFRVEEYKRPKFYVEYEKLKGTYTINDSIKVTGIAKAYAGNNINGARVKYRVVREARFLYPWLFRKWWMPPSASQEITHGETQTGEDGKFTIDFTALPDKKVETRFDPVFDYTVYADVTDINGETRSGELTVPVSYKSFILNVTVPPVMAADSLKSFNIRTENLNQEPVKTIVQVRISRLKEEKRLIRNRYWERPDQFVLHKDEYVRAFPHDEYDNESDMESWEEGEWKLENGEWKVENGEWKLGSGNRMPGFYKVEITASAENGEEVKDVKYMELTDEKNGRLNRPEYLWTGQQKTTAEPGDTARVELGSSAEKLFLLQEINRYNPSDGYFVKKLTALNLSEERKTFSFPVTEDDRGGFGVSWVFVKHNRVYQQSCRMLIPWSNKDLQVDYLSYRDKTEPGATEKWTLRVSGYKKEKLAAELLASMYDASLDQFVPHTWQKPAAFSVYNSWLSWNGRNNFNAVSAYSRYNEAMERQYRELVKEYDAMLPLGRSLMFAEMLQGRVAGISVKDGMIAESKQFTAPAVARDEKLEDIAVGYSADIRIRGLSDIPAVSEPLYVVDGVIVNNIKNILPDEIADLKVLQPAEATALYGEKGAQGAIIITTKKGQAGKEVTVRKNFDETAFYYPALRTDSSGNLEFSFTLPEALSRWKFQALAHTKEAAFGYSSKEIVTQKELMVQPNPPRFLREGDKMEFSAKIVNLSDKELTGTAELQLIDALTNQSVDGWFRNAFPNQYFTVAAGQSEAVNFPIEVPYLFNKALTWRIVARSGNYSDGEENILPVMTNRMLVTESLPLQLKGSGIKEFRFDKLLKSGESGSLQQHALTIEFTSNPAWYAVQALPWLMEYPYDCAEQTWNRYFANSLASHIVHSAPRIRTVFEKWKTSDSAVLLSNLSKNQELKALLLEETPWVLEAKTEEQQKKNIALLFDLVKMNEELGRNIEKLKEIQSPNGGFVWFRGGPDDRYITQYILSGIGHLFKLKAVAKGQEEQLKTILDKALPYLDRKAREDYDQLVKQKTNLKTWQPDQTTILYLYMRSFFPDYPVAKTNQQAWLYFKGRAAAGWSRHSKYMQGMIALISHRNGDSKTSTAILQSLKETSVYNEELGRYWKQERRGWFWFEMPLETQSLLTEVFAEAGKDNTTVDELRTWLMKNKQTNNWGTTKATAEACYALLIRGSDWLSAEPAVEIKLGNTLLKSSEKQTEAGTGYFKSTIPAEKIHPQMGNIAVTVTAPANATWGSVYWQYFEDLDKITTAETPLKLSKKLFVQTNTDRGPVLRPVEEGQAVKVGDKIVVRVELRADRDMEYIHMKDMRASALEPVNVISQYKWQGGLGYYESTKDASTNFFISYLRKGTYVFEYALFATHAGEFSNGITSIQCMYAPEFSAHSEGVRIVVE